MPLRSSTSPGVGLSPFADRAAYATSKGGLITLGKVLAMGFAPRYRVNTICPGLIDTPMTAALPHHNSNPDALKRYALQRLGQDVEVAQAALFRVPPPRPSSPASPWRSMAAAHSTDRASKYTGGLNMNRHIADQIDAAIDPVTVAERWLGDFSRALRMADQTSLSELFTEEAYWRDLLTCQWDFRSLKGRALICEQLLEETPDCEMRDFEIDCRYSAPHWEVRGGTRVIEVIFAFSTSIGVGNGVVRLVPVEANQREYRAWGLMTSLQSLNGHPEGSTGPPERIAVKNPELARPDRAG